MPFEKKQAEKVTQLFERSGLYFYQQQEILT